MGAVKRYPYPKEVWSPAGGWWSRPANWKSNTTIITAGIFVIVGFVWKISAEQEWRHNKPNQWIPSMMWSKQFKDGEYRNLKFDTKKQSDSPN